MPPMGFRPPVTLQGRYVRLVPLETAHAAPLFEAGHDPDLWRYLVSRRPTSVSAMRELVDHLLELQGAGTDLPFTILDAEGRSVLGMTRYLKIERGDGAVEIGGTWVTPTALRTPVNTEAKRLLLGHAFEVEGAHRVQLYTDLRNDRSQRAIERLGARREGIVREHRVMSDGYRRSSVVYSILADEWPSVRRRLDRLLARPWPTAAATTGAGTAPAASP